MSKSPNPDIIDKIYFRNIYSCQRKIYWYKVKVMETINAVWEHSYGEDCIPNFSANMEQPRHRWYEFKEGFSLTLVERAIRETKKDNKSTSFTVLDPFSGSGTSPLTALQSRCNAIGYEVNPFMSFVGKTKCQQRTKSIHDYTKELNRILVQRPFRLKSPLEGVSTFTGSGENGKWLFNLDVLRAGSRPGRSHRDRGGGPPGGDRPGLPAGGSEHRHGGGAGHAARHRGEPGPPDHRVPGGPPTPG